MHVTAGQTLYRVADLSRVWVEADVYEQEMPFIRVGRPAIVTLDAYPGERFVGRSVYVYPFVEERTRTVRVRFEFPNPSGRLRPGMYANVELQAPAGTGLTVPGNAVVESGRQQIVFVALGDGYFEPRRVTIGRRLDDRVEILENLKEGEQVAIGATFFLDSESQLRGALQGYQPLPAATGETSTAARLTISFRSQPDPPKAGDNTFEVTVKDAEGRPMPDADVSVTFFMAAMPTMNMPAMRSEAKLSGIGNGVYRGVGQILSRGRWDVTVTVTRGGQRLGANQFAVTTQ
jgi:Cu(I)/Ag(I) efflux system membrane fusion protein/cobalt-zinc-cadmium efflux system membrane fusion protein